MKIMTKEIDESGTNFIIYVMDANGSPLTCEYGNINNKNSIIEGFDTKFGGITNREVMTYNEYINQ
jgi:hypothetical protein